MEYAAACYKESCTAVVYMSDVFFGNAAVYGDNGVSALFINGFSEFSKSLV